LSGHRGQRVADVVREVLARSVREDLRDPQVGFVTITGVEMSPDLRHARVYVAAHGDDLTRGATIDGLNRAAPFLRRALAHEARLRFTPDLRFIEDSGVEHGSRVESLLSEIHSTDEAPSVDREEDPEE
jgi:ribosome-binding factor A